MSERHSPWHGTSDKCLRDLYETVGNVGISPDTKAHDWIVGVAVKRGVVSIEEALGIDTRPAKAAHPARGYDAPTSLAALEDVATTDSDPSKLFDVYTSTLGSEELQDLQAAVQQRRRLLGALETAVLMRRRAMSDEPEPSWPVDKAS